MFKVNLTFYCCSLRGQLCVVYRSIISEQCAFITSDSGVNSLISHYTLVLRASASNRSMCVPQDSDSQSQVGWNPPHHPLRLRGVPHTREAVTHLRKVGES